MEQVFYQIHSRIAQTSIYYFKPHHRKVIELFILSLAISSICLTSYLHRVYVSVYDNKTNCLSYLNIDKSSNIFLTNLSYAVVKINLVDNIIDNSNISIKVLNFDNEDFKNNLYYVEKEDKIRKIKTFMSMLWSHSLRIFFHNKPLNLSQCSSAFYDSNYFSLIDSFLSIFDNQGSYIYSMEKDLAIPLSIHNNGRYLSPQRNVTIVFLSIPKNNVCFGPKLARNFVRYLVGYDTAVINWAIDIFDARGYIYNLNSHELFTLHYAWEFFSPTSLYNKTNTNSSNSQVYFGFNYLPFYENKNFTIKDLFSSNVSSYLSYYRLNMNSTKILSNLTSYESINHITKKIVQKFGILLTILLIFFTTSTTVSFMLRETQQRMLKFTYLLQYAVTNRQPYAMLVFTHTFEILVFVPIMIGIMFLMMQFFKDQVLTLNVWSVVWSAEVYSVLCLRTRISIYYFPKIFLIYFSLFHIYFFNRPFGFVYLSMLSTCLFILHAMVYFFHNYEMPAIEQGTVNGNIPRLGLISSGLFDRYVIRQVDRQVDSLIRSPVDNFSNQRVQRPTTRRQNSRRHRTTSESDSSIDSLTYDIVDVTENTDDRPSNNSVEVNENRLVDSRSNSPRIIDGSNRNNETNRYRGLYSPDRSRRIIRRNDASRSINASSLISSSSSSTKTTTTERIIDTTTERRNFYQNLSNNSIPVLELFGAVDSYSSSNNIHENYMVSEDTGNSNLLDLATADSSDNLSYDFIDK